MRSEDAQQMVELITKAQAGRRLVPHASYRDFRFRQPIDTPSDARATEARFRPSRDW